MTVNTGFTFLTALYEHWLNAELTKHHVASGRHTRAFQCESHELTATLDLWAVEKPIRHTALPLRELKEH